MIFRVLSHSVGVVLLAAVVGALIDPAIVRAAVEHLAGGLEELVEIGERLGQSDAGRQITSQLSSLARRMAQ